MSKSEETYHEIFTPPKNTTIHQSATGIYWFDEDGILISTTKKDPPKLSLEENQKELDKFITNFGEVKRCLLIDAKYAKASRASERKQTAEIIPKVTKAMAIIIHNPLGRMVTNLYIGLEKPNFPMKAFKPGEEQKALDWLRTHL